ncbi:MAG TPA: 4Fe-4S dicluster domain-containing protein [bacterium]|nr:4Fe-4S dicluster domain-containing protein [bacterium]
MMKKVLQKRDLVKLFDTMKAAGKLYGLASEDGRYLFKEVNDLLEPGCDYWQTILPPKKYFLPQIETLLSYRKDGWDANQPAFDRTKFVVWGIRPCDIHAVNLLDRIFEADNPDSHYLTRRKNAMIVGFTCQTPCDERAFCADIGTLDVKTGFDFLLTDIGDRYLVMVGTEAAEKIEQKLPAFADAAPADEKKLGDVAAARVKAFAKRLKTAVEELPLLFKGSANNPLWEAEGKRCLGCGSCNLVCPTCYCFDVQDKNEVNLAGGERVRKWDGCMLKDFTRVAGGEVFRHSKAGRLKHRWHRKFDYLMTKWGQSNCVGCGRCGRACLVNINPIDIVNGLAGKS